jgi:hypothetical protein
MNRTKKYKEITKYNTKFIKQPVWGEQLQFIENYINRIDEEKQKKYYCLYLEKGIKPEDITNIPDIPVHYQK